MPRGNPSYRLHKPSGQAVVTIQGRDIYLGPHGSAASHAKYAEIMGHGSPGLVQPAGGMSLAEGVAAYLAHAETYYRDQEGRDTRHLPRIKRALFTLVELSPELSLARLGRAEIKLAQRVWMSQGLSRRYINALLVVTKTALKWMAREGLLPVTCWHEVQLVEGLKQGRTPARETEPVHPVPEADVWATLDHLGETLQAMVLFQLYTGARSGEVVAITHDQVDTSAEVWAYRPVRHKNRWRGHERVIWIGQRAREILEPRMALPGDLPLFWCVRPRTGKPGAYQVESYARAVARACERAGVTVWRPGQLRHTAATRIQGEIGWDAARAVLGHRTVSTTRIYADRDGALASQAARLLG